MLWRSLSKYLVQKLGTASYVLWEEGPPKSTAHLTMSKEVLMQKGKETQTALYEKGRVSTSEKHCKEQDSTLRHSKNVVIN